MSTSNWMDEIIPPTPPPGPLPMLATVPIGEGFGATVPQATPVKVASATPQYYGTTAQGTALTDIPDYQQALLNAISGPESGGKYNIRYTPKGGAIFNGYDAHPAIAEPTINALTGKADVSTAAGRYQITKTTWGDLKARGLIPQNATFSPEWQDRAALALAADRYKASTGEDLWTELQQNGLSSKVMGALGSTWIGLRDNPGKAQEGWTATLGGKLKPGVAYGPQGSTQAKASAPQGSWIDSILPAGAVAPEIKNTDVTLPAIGQNAAATGFQPAPVDWGKTAQLMHGINANHGPESQGLVEASRFVLQQIAKGMPPGMAVRTAQEEVYPQVRDAWDAARKQYEESAGFTGQAIKGVGNLAPAAVVAMGGGGVLGALGKALPAAAPALSFIGGAAPQGTGMLGKLAAGATQGAWQGAGQALLQGEDAKSGALAGAVLGGPTGMLAQALTAPVRATALPEAARVAQQGLDAGVSVPASSIIKNPTIKKLVESFSGKGDAETAQEFTKAVAKTFGADKDMAAAGVKGLTPDVMDAAGKRIGQGFETFANNTQLKFDTRLFNEMHSVVQEAQRDLGTVRPDIAKKLDDFFTTAFATSANKNAVISGKEFRALTNSNSDLQDLFNIPDAVPYAKKMIDALTGALERASPGSAKEIAELRNQYKILKTLEPAADKVSVTGLLDSRAAGALQSAGLDDLGAVSKLMPRLNAGGAEGHYSIWDYIRKGGPGVTGAAAGLVAHTGLEGLAGLYHYPLLTTAAATTWGAANAARNAAGRYMAGPAFTQRVIDNTLGAPVHTLFNPLTAMTQGMAPGFAPNPIPSGR